MESNVTATQNSSGVALSFYRKEQVTFLSTLLVAILVGNSAVLVAIGLSKQKHKTRMNFLIMHLAVADLLVGLIGVLTDLIWKITLAWHAGNIMCKSVRYGQAVVIYASTYVLVALSIDRLDAIVRPMNFLGGNQRARLLVSLAWTLSFVFSLPMLFINKVAMSRDGMTQCRIQIVLRWHWQVYVTLISVVLFIIPAIVIAGCYITIVYTIWSKTKVMGSTPSMARLRYSINKTQCHCRPSCDRNSCCGEKKGHSVGIQRERTASSRGIIPQAKIKTIKMTLVIVIVFILCWSPFFVFDLMDVFGLVRMEPMKHKAVNIFIQSLAPLNSVANPVIFYIFSASLPRRLRRAGGCRCWLLGRLVRSNDGDDNSDSAAARAQRRTQDLLQKSTLSAAAPHGSALVGPFNDDDNEDSGTPLTVGRSVARRKFNGPPKSGQNRPKTRPDESEEHADVTVITHNVDLY